MLPRIDNVPIDYIDINEDFKKWLTNLVDTLNTTLDQLDNQIADIEARLTACGC